MSYLHGPWPMPQVVILHLSGNDIGKCNTLELMTQMKSNLLCFHAASPDTVLIFSEIAPRLNWLLYSEFKYI